MTTDDPRPPRDTQASGGSPPAPERLTTPPLDLEGLAGLDAAEAAELAPPTWGTPAAEVAIEQVPSAADSGPSMRFRPLDAPAGPSLVSRLADRVRAAIGLGKPGTRVWPDRADATPATRRAPRFTTDTTAIEAPPAPVSDTAPLDASSTAPAFATEPFDPTASQTLNAPETPAIAATGAVAESSTPLRLPFPWNAFIALVAGIETVAFLMFLLLEPTPRWVLLVAAGVAVAGMDGALRATYREPFEAGADTTPYLFLPALYAFAAPLIIEHNASGYAVPVWGLVAGVGFAVIAVAEVMSVRTGSRAYPYARLAASAAAYFAAFGLLAMPYLLDLGLPAAVVASWLVCAMLGIELLREGEIDPLETAIFAAVTAIVVAQTRWLLFFLPLDGYLAGLTLLLVFFLAVGVLHAYVVRQLTVVVAGEYAVIAAVGIAAVVAARAAGIA